MNRFMKVINSILPVDNTGWIETILSSVIIDGDKIVFDNDGDRRSDNDWNILLFGWSAFIDERRLSLDLYNEDNDEDNETVSQFKSILGTCFLSLSIGRIH
jgi:hypothetical protein